MISGLQIAKGSWRLIFSIFSLRYALWPVVRILMRCLNMYFNLNIWYIFRETETYDVSTEQTETFLTFWLHTPCYLEEWIHLSETVSTYSPILIQTLKDTTSNFCHFDDDFTWPWELFNPFQMKSSVKNFIIFF